MNRRKFMAMGLAAGATAVSATVSKADQSDKKPKNGKFKLNYAPMASTFKEHVGKDPIEAIKFSADQGFTAFFDNGLMGRPVKKQQEIAAELAKHEMLLGPFVIYAKIGVKTFVLNDPDIRKMLLEKMKTAIECAKRTNAKWGLVVPGHYDEKLDWSYQTANVVDNLRYCAEILEPAGLVMVLEPLNTIKNHPGAFLTGIPQSYQICKAVNSPSCKIVNDLYHQQITEGNLISNIDMAWDQIASFHIGDNPGRKEPTTGEINYTNIFKHLYQKGYKGVICMEHGNSKPGKQGELDVIQAYRECDNFEV